MNSTLFEQYISLNDQLLCYIMQGGSESKQANEIRSNMDRVWKQLSLIEQQLAKEKLEGPISKR